MLFLVYFSLFRNNYKDICIYRQGNDCNRSILNIVTRHSNGRKRGRTKEPLRRVEEESEKAGLKLNIKKTKIVASGPTISWQIDGEKWKQWQNLFLGAPKSLQMVTAAMKLKDACHLEEKL